MSPSASPRTTCSATATPSRSASTPRTRPGGAFPPRPARSPDWSRPGGPGVRLDAGYESGDTVSQFYDNLVAKLVVWGHDREAARRRMLRAIEETVIEGVATTLPADVAILSHPDFIAGEHSTNWVEQTLDLTGVTSDATAVGPTSAPADGWRGGAPGAPGRHRRGRRAALPGQALGARPRRRRRRARPAARPRGAGPKRPKAAAGGAAGSGTVAVPMQGTIVKVLVAVGDAVEVGQTVCVLEAMKMENNVNAEKSGTVKEVRVAPGESVGPGDVIAVIE